MNPTSTSNSQNYNRFSYVLNNPLKYTDPSGYVALNPWYETMINGMRFFKEYPEMGETFKDKNDNLWKLKKDMKFSDENGNVFLRMIGDGLYVEIAKYQEYQEKLQQYNSQFENADFGFIAGAGVFRVEGNYWGEDVTTEFYFNTTFSFGPQLGVKLNLFNLISIGGYISAANVDRNISISLKHTKRTGWNFNIDSDAKNINVSNGYNLPFYNYSQTDGYGAKEHSAFSKISIIEQKGLSRDYFSYYKDPDLSGYQILNTTNLSVGGSGRYVLFGFDFEFGVNGYFK